MKTDVFVKVCFDSENDSAVSVDIDSVFSMFRDFERQYSRFLPESELSKLNASEELSVSSELFEILSRSAGWFRETGGVFDPSIASVLESSGYAGSFGTEAFGISSGKTPGVSEAHVFSEISLFEDGRTVRKPIGLRIDLGGIGKGYLVDRVSDFLSTKYRNFFVCAGGDIRVSGADVANGYDFWAVDIENPVCPGNNPLLVLHDRSVATSGIGRRKWVADGGEWHHLIDPKTGRSAETDLFSVTVVAGNVEEAEIWSKTICILGSVRGRELANKRGLPVVFLEKDGTMTANEYANEYLWKSAS